MKTIIFFFALVVWAFLQSCDTMIEPEGDDFSEIKPVFLLPSEPSTTLYNNQKISFFRISSVNGIDTIKVFHADTVLLFQSGYAEWGNFIDIYINQKFEPGTHVFKVQFVSRYRYESDFTEISITVLPENMPDPEIIITGLEDGILKNNKAITLQFNSNPNLFSGEINDRWIHYYFEHEGYYSYNQIESDVFATNYAYFELDPHARIHFMEQNDYGVFNIPADYYTILDDELVDITGVAQENQMTHTFGWFPFFNEGQKYTMFMVANNGWLRTYYWIDELEYTTQW